MSWLWPNSKVGWVAYMTIFACLVLYVLSLAGKMGILDDVRAQYQASQAMAAATTKAVYEVNEHMLAHAEATSIISCLNNKGPAIKFKSLTNKNAYYLMCELPDKKWGLAEFIDNGTKKPTPQTAFIREDGCITKVYNYLQKFATKFTKPLPWEGK